MIISGNYITPFDFDGLRITDYTAGRNTSSSFAEITVPPGAVHRRAYSKRSDKYYYIVSGRIRFDIEDESYGLSRGDVCVVLKGREFSYRNETDEPALIILVHTPGFDPESEFFVE